MQITAQKRFFHSPVRRLWRHFCADSLFRNSVYLMLATGVMAGFGFFFWLISAHLVSTENIGLATTLISVMNMISIFSLIGFDSTIVRFLAHSPQRNNKLNTSIILVGTAAILLGGLFIVFVRNISPQLSFIQSSIPMSIGFVLFCGMSAINILTDAVFLAYRQTKFSLIINTLFSFVKMLLPFAFMAWGAFGIFSAAAVGQSIGFMLSIAVMIWKFDYKPQFAINISIIKDVWHYSLGNYIAGSLNLLPVLFLPIIITNHLGASQAAYFYIVMMIGNLLYVIPQAATRSLFAEGSYDAESIEVNTKKTLLTISVFLFPSVTVLITAGKYILDFFGKGYSSDGTYFLYLISVSGFAVTAYAIFNSIFRVNKNLKALITTNIFYLVSIISLSYLFLPLGLVGIGFAWLAGNIVASITGATLSYQQKIVASD